MPEPPPLPDSNRRRSPPPLPHPPALAELDPRDWIAALRAMGFREDPDVAVKVGLNLIGEVEGKTVRVHASRRTKTKYAGSEISYRVYHGHRIEITVITDVSTRCAISFPRSALERWVAKSNRWFQSQPVVVPNEPLSEATIWASEPDWARSFLGGLRSELLLTTLLPPDNLPPNVGLKWWPGFLTFSQRLDIRRVDSVGATDWVDCLVALAIEAESNPPAERVELTRWEKFSLDQPFMAGCLILLALLIPMLLCGCLLAGVLLTLSFFLS